MRKRPPGEYGFSILQVFVLIVIFGILALIIQSLINHYQASLKRQQVLRSRDQITEMLNGTLINSVAALSYTVAKCETNAATNPDYPNYTQNPIFCHCFKKKNCLSTFKSNLDGTPDASVPAYPTGGFPFYLYRSDPQNAHQPLAGGGLTVCKSSPCVNPYTDAHQKYATNLISSNVDSWITGLRSQPLLNSTAASNTAEFFKKILNESTVDTTSPLQLPIPPELTVRYSEKGELCTLSQFSGDTAKMLEHCPFAVELTFKVGGTDGNAAYIYSPAQIQICYQVNFTSVAGEPQIASVSNQTSGKCTTLREIMDRASGKYVPSGGSSSSASSGSPGSVSPGSSSIGSPGSLNSTDSASSNSSETLVSDSSLSSSSSQAGSWPASASSSTGEAPWVNPEYPVGTIRSIVGDSNAMYIGGDFSFTGPLSGAAVQLNTNTFAPILPNDANKIYGKIYASVPDGNNGFYLGGELSVNSEDFKLVYIDTAGLVSKKIIADAAVRSLVMIGSTVYIGGDFTSIGGQTRNHLAALSNGNITAWDPKMNTGGIVNDLATDGSDVYVGGKFSTLNGITRRNLAKVNSDGNVIAAWDPYSAFCWTALGLCDAMAISALTYADSNLYAGGKTIIYKTPAPANKGFGLVKITAEGVMTPIGDPTINGYRVSKLTFGSGYLYSVSASGTTLFALDSADYFKQKWRYNIDGSVNSLITQGSVLYLGGTFGALTKIGGSKVARPYLVSISIPDGNLTPAVWPITGNVLTLAISSSAERLFSGGENISFMTKTGTGYLRALSPSDGKFINSFDSGISTSIRSLALDSSSVYVTSGERLISIDRSNVNPVTHKMRQNWERGVCGSSSALLLSGQSLAVGGSCPGKFDLTGHPTADYKMNGMVHALAANTSTLYMGGQFLGTLIWQINEEYGHDETGAEFVLSGSDVPISGEPRLNLAAMNLNSNTLTPWNPGANGAVYALALVDSVLYIGGDFTQIGSTDRNRLAAFDASGTLTAWNPGANGAVYALVASGSTLYVGGNFTQIGSHTKDHLAAITTSGTIKSGNPGADATVYALRPTDNFLYVGGAFSKLNGKSSPYFGQVNRASF